MIRFAHLIGVMGSGKGWVAERFRDRAHILTIDLVQKAAGGRLISSTEPRAVWKWNLWKDVIQTSSAVSEIAKAITDRYGTSLTDGRPILAEAAILAWNEWRESFVSALQSLGVQPERQQVFWLDPTNERRLENIRTRNRESERGYDMKQAVESQQWFHGVASQHRLCRYPDADTTVNAIENYLFPPQGRIE